MLLTMHHIISDGWSRKVFFQELAALYQATGVHHPCLNCRFSMQILHFGSGSGLKVRDSQPNLRKQQLDAAPQCWDCPQTIRDLLFKLPWRERNPDTPNP